MLLGTLLKSVDKNYKSISIKGISFDSRKIKKGDIFFSIQGNKTSGNNFIKEAQAKGAAAIISSKDINYKNNKIPFILVKDVRKSLAVACSNFYKKKPKNIIAVTGTNGKSSVADFFYQILSLNNVKVASIGTLGILSKNYNRKTNLTSMDPLSLHKSLEILAKDKINNVILEASSHGLKQKRLDGINIKTGIFTNLSHDHLDYHKTMESYFKSKMYLFNKLLNNNSTIITDEDNKEFNFIKNIASKKKIDINSIGKSSGSIRVLDNKYINNKQIVKIYYKSKFFLIQAPLIGHFQIKNLFMAVLAALNCGLGINKVFNTINKIKPVPGRLECIVKFNNNSKIIIDFAHTPEALEKSLLALKKQFKAKIIIVFGCGGERDKKKRFIMGRIAQNHCQKVFVTDDNPRNENPALIRESIIKGCKNKSINIGNRKKAIESGIKALGPNEILLVAGKGHETNQDYGKKIMSFSDKTIIKQICKKKNLHLNNNQSNFIFKKTFNSLENINYSGASINSKNIKKNNLFFAIKGKRIDGHKFAVEAVRKGAIRSVVNKKVKKLSKKRTIKVRNAFSSLNLLAEVTRYYTRAKIIGITGSVGKTTLKNLTSFAIKNYGHVYSSPQSYNNQFGVPLSLSNLKNNTEYGVFEIGMNKKGEVKKLSKIVKPEIAVITNISEAHLKNFNNLKDIAKAKAEIIDNVSENGSIILNKDDRFFNFLSHKAKKKKINIISFSAKRKADIFLSKIKIFDKYCNLKVIVDNKTFYFKTKNSTNALVSNILACISVLYVLNLDLDIMKNKFNHFSIPDGRGDIKIIKKFKKNFKLIDESYNANPRSMSSAIDNINNYKRKNNEKKLVFLGDMLELGKKSKSFHKHLSSKINKTDIDKVYIYGNYIKETYNFLSIGKKGKVFKNLKEAYTHFGKIIKNNDLLMIKGSNATGLNQFAKNLKKGQSSVI